MCSTQVIITRAKSPEDFRRFKRVFLTRPVVLIMFFVTGPYVVAMGGSSYRYYELPMQFVINFCWASFYYAYYFAYSDKANLLMVKYRVPYFLGFSIFLIFPVSFESVFGALFLHLEQTPMGVISYLFLNWLFVIPATAIIIAFEQKLLIEGQFVVPPQKFLWFVWKDATISTDHTLPEILRLEASNQYTVFYFLNGERRQERMSLTKAVEKYCQPQSGLRVHRAHYVEYRCVHATRFENGNPKLELITGEEIPISRSAYKKLKAREQVDHAKR